LRKHGEQGKLQIAERGVSIQHSDNTTFSGKPFTGERAQAELRFRNGGIESITSSVVTNATG